MKKLMSMILALSMVLSMAACNADVQEPGNTPTVPSVATLPAEPETSEPVADPQPVTVSGNTIREVSNREGWGFDMTLTYTDIVVSTGNVGVDMAIRSDLEGELQQTQETAEDIMNSMDEAVASGRELLSASSVTRSISPARVDDRIISLNGYLSVFSDGAAHPSTVQKSETYSVETGSRLTLWDVVKDEAQVAALKELVLTRLAEREQQEELGFFPEYAKTVDMHFDPADENSGSWYLTNEGIVCVFSTYEIASYAVGAVEVLVTCEEMPELLKPEYLPVDAPAGEGELLANLAGEDTPAYTVVQSWNSAQIDLTASAYVTDVRLETVVTFDGESYESTGTIFAADYLDGSQVVRLYADIPDTLPNLRLTYTGQRGEVVRYITQSGEDGSILLIEQ